MFELASANPLTTSVLVLLALLAIATFMWSGKEYFIDAHPLGVHGQYMSVGHRFNPAWPTWNPHEYV